LTLTNPLWSQAGAAGKLSGRRPEAARLQGLAKEATASEAEARTALESAAHAAVGRLGYQPNVNGPWAALVERVREAADALPVQTRVFTSILVGPAIERALAELRPPAQEPATASAPAAIEVSQPLAVEGVVVSLQRPQGTNTVTRHRPVPPPGVVIEKPDPDAPRTLKPDDLSGKPSAYPGA
jgi:hypothetical protein